MNFLAGDRHVKRWWSKNGGDSKIFRYLRKIWLQAKTGKAIDFTWGKKTFLNPYFIVELRLEVRK